MKSKFYLMGLAYLLLSALSPHHAKAQAESHNFITYDTTYKLGSLTYSIRISRPANMFKAGDPDTASRPAIITMPGQGEMGTNLAKLQSFGPHYWLNNGWDGGVVLGNGTHYPILITMICSYTYVQPDWNLAVLNYLLNTYHIKRNSVHLGGLSQGAFTWSAMITYESSPGAEDGMKPVTSLTILSGAATVQPGPGYPYFGHWAKKYGGKMFATVGTADAQVINPPLAAKAMNDSVPGSAYFTYNSVGGGTHCCWNTEYDPKAVNWQSFAPLGTYITTSTDTNARGTYYKGESIFQWMLRQGDTTLVGSGTPTTPTGPVMTPPTVSAGADQNITLPQTSATLTGTATPASGTTIASIAWTQESGAAATITNPGSASTTVTGLAAGVYVFKLTVTSDAGVTSVSTVTLTVKASVLQDPIVSAGAGQTITLPTSTVILGGTASDPNGGTIVKYAWTQKSGTAAVINSAAAATTTVMGLSAGASVFTLTVTTSEGTTASADVTITVNPAVSVPASGPLPIKKVIVCEYRVFYIGSDNNVYGWNGGGALKVFPIGGNKVVDGDGAFNQFRVLDDKGYIWSSRVDWTLVTDRVETDTTGAAFDKNVKVFAYKNTTLTVRTDGSLWYYGNDDYNLFSTAGVTGMRPVQLSPAGMQIKKVALGSTRIVALTVAGDVYEWVIGKGKTPVKKTIPAPAIDVFASHFDYAGCIVEASAGATSGDPYVWGTSWGSWGAKGGPTYSTPTNLSTLWGLKYPIKEISVDWNTTHYIDTQGDMYGFGFNSQGEVGNGEEFVNKYTYSTFPGYGWTFTDSENPVTAPAVQIGKGVKWSKLYSNNWFGFYKYAQAENGDLYSWGRGKALVLGNGFSCVQEAAHPNALDVLVPTLVTPMSTTSQSYDWTPPAISAGVNQTITSTTATLTGTATAPQLIKNSAVAANGINRVGYNIISYKWTQVSGPAATITNPNSATTTVTGMTPGTYVFNLLTTDNNTGTQSANVTITVSSTAPGNKAPTANAGADQTITLPTSSVNLTGSGTDTDGTIASYTWQKITGPSNPAIVTASQANTQVNNLVAGVYTFQLTVFDNQGATGLDTVQITVKPAPVVPGPPVANAGADQTITLPTSSVTLTGSGSEVNGTITGYAWTQVTGPAGAVFGSADKATTTVTGLVKGVYTFQLKVTDNSGVTATDLVTVIVNAAIVPGPPVANAGADQTITLPTSSVTLTGSGSEVNGTITGYAWTQVTGPAGAVFGSADKATTTVTGLVKGVYTFQLKVTDNSGVTATDLVTVIVNAAVVPGPPVANAGTDQTITLPTNSVTLTGSGSEVNGTITGYAWTQVTGPAGAVFGSADKATTTVTGLVQGVYTFQLKVTDNSGVTATDVVTVIVNAAVVPGTPVADAGTDQVITLPTNSVTLTGSGSEVNGTITGYAWTQVNGPAGAVFGSADKATTTVTGLVAGVYTFQITVTDNAGVTAVDVVKVTVNPAVVPGTPVANAGPDQVITLPTNSVTLTGSGSEVNGTITGYAWTQVNGPAAAVFGSADKATTTVTGLVAGVYTFEITVTDNSGVEAVDVVKVTVNPAIVPGTPVANAGPDQVITLPVNSATLTGSGSEVNGTITGYAWTQVNGPAAAVFGSADKATTTVGSLVQGIYTFQLTVTDNSGVEAVDVIKVTVNPAVGASNQAPVADAGGDKIVPDGAIVDLDGSGSYDPDGTIVKYQWVQISGAGGVTLSGSNTATPGVYGLTPGVYVFQLTVTDDKGATGTATVQVTVTTANTVPNPIAIAGNDTTLVLPDEQTTLLDGSLSYDRGATLVSYRWRQVSGPVKVTIADAANSKTMAEGFQAGVYKFELTVTDDKGLSASDTVAVFVQSNFRTTGFVKLYPNPVNAGNQIMVEGQNDYVGKIRYTIYDMGGRLVKVLEADKQSPYLQQAISLGSIGKGAYMMTVMFDGVKKPVVLQFIVD